MLVETHHRGNIALLLLNNPGEHNCLSGALVRDMLCTLRSDQVQKSRALVIGGMGNSFCAGANIQDLLTQGWIEGRNLEFSPVTLFRQLVNDPRPIIGAVDGLALGGGFELALSCDLVIASDRASFSLPEAGYGVIPNTGLALLSQSIGRRRALEWMMTLRRIPAQEAFNLGLVNEVVPSEILLDRAVQTAELIVGKCAPGALGEIKKSLNIHGSIDWQEVGGSLTRIPREQWLEGLSAFLERRKPDYEIFWRKNA
jgi:enoyl-CoA hydratase/carnithine racemase